MHRRACGHRNKKCKHSEQHKYHTETVLKSHAVAGAMLCVFVPTLVSIGNTIIHLGLTVENSCGPSINYDRFMGPVTKSYPLPARLCTTALRQHWETDRGHVARSLAASCLSRFDHAHPRTCKQSRGDCAYALPTSATRPVMRHPREAVMYCTSCYKLI